MSRRIIASVAIAASTLVPPAAYACFLETGPKGALTTSDPLTIPVLVAGRAAAAEDRIDWFRSSDVGAVRQTVFLLSLLPRTAAIAATPMVERGFSFSVLQVQTGYWTRYQGSENGALSVEAHRSGPAAGDDVIAVSDSALVAIMRGRLDFETAARFGLIQGRGDSIEIAMAAFEGIVQGFGASRSEQPRSALARGR